MKLNIHKACGEVLFATGVALGGHTVYDINHPYVHDKEGVCILTDNDSYTQYIDIPNSNHVHEIGFIRSYNGDEAICTNNTDPEYESILNEEENMELISEKMDSFHTYKYELVENDEVDTKKPIMEESMLSGGLMLAGAELMVYGHKKQKVKKRK